jgi:hypothetical protein
LRERENLISILNRVCHAKKKTTEFDKNKEAKRASTRENNNTNYEPFSSYSYRALYEIKLKNSVRGVFFESIFKISTTSFVR